jgi:hypothetical protein
VVNFVREYTREQQQRIINFAVTGWAPIGLMVPFAIWYLSPYCPEDSRRFATAGPSP